MATKVTEKEVRFARSFLHALHANEANGYLLLAVIAWMRSESGQTYIGNNPFNIRNSPLAIGYRQTKNHNGHFAIFKDLQTAARATVAFLLQNHGNGYEAIVKAARRYSADAKSDAKQAVDFMNYIALSKWDAGRYGTRVTKHEGAHLVELAPDLSKNKIVKVWQLLTGGTLPKKWFIDPAPKPPKPKPPPPPPVHQPRSLQHAIARSEYIEPYAARHFYEARPHLGDNVLTDDV